MSMNWHCELVWLGWDEVGLRINQLATYSFNLFLLALSRVEEWDPRENTARVGFWCSFLSEDWGFFFDLRRVLFGWRWTLVGV